MQILGLSDSPPRTESRLKTLFWPTIRNDVDLDTVTTQGFWICFIVAAFTLGVGLFAGFTFIGVVCCFEGAFYFLAGIGVRMRSRFAAATALAAYFMGGVVLM